MSRTAPRVHSDPETIARLEALARRLPESGRVALTLDDGSILQGLVSAVPSIQTFYDADGNEGLNALVRIEVAHDDRHEAHSDGYVWLDRISDVARLPNPSPPQASERSHPQDPNAPAPEHDL